MQSHEVARNGAMAVAAGAPSLPFLSAYSAAIKRYELLEPGHEQQLARRWRRRGTAVP